MKCFTDTSLKRSEFFIAKLMSVSYTHLLTVGCSSSENNDIQTSEVKQGEEAVSYTHLDVYKRQTLCTYY